MAPWAFLALPLLIGSAWLADRWDLGGMFVPGQPVGYAAANLVGAFLVARWQRAHGGAVVLVHAGSDPELYVSTR